MNLFIKPRWPAPPFIHAYCTLRSGGVSLPPFDTFNLAEHVGDHPEHVFQNREILKQALKIPSEPIWLHQTHSTLVLPATPENRYKEADASFSTTANQVCVILTADCLPILICNTNSTCVAAIHGGWRGLLNGIIKKTLTAIHHPKAHWLAWLGPSIGPTCYEVGPEVREAFLAVSSHLMNAFTPSHQDRWFANLPFIAMRLLQNEGISDIYSSDLCTFTHPHQFYSYRRDGNQTGRMASLIWIDNP